MQHFIISYSFCWTSSSYFDLSIILHLKFCCIFMACCILMTKIDHTITVTASRSKLIRSGSDLTKSHDGMNHSRNQVRKTDQILNVTATTHKFQKRHKLVRQQEEEFIIRGIPQPCAYRRRLGAFTKVILPDLSTLTSSALRPNRKPP